MSAARVLHFGDDACNRVAVLEKAGYDVSVCRSGPELIQEVQDPGVDAILFTQDPRKQLQLQEIRSLTRIPFVLFGDLNERASSTTFDLVIEPITSPQEWLERLSKAIQRGREIGAQSALIRRESAALRTGAESTCRESEAVRRESTEVRQRLQETRDKLPNLS